VKNGIRLLFCQRDLPYFSWVLGHQSFHTKLNLAASSYASL